MEEPEKTYIKTIIVEGLECLSAQEQETITAPFTKHWLTKDNIGQLIEYLRKAYKDKGCGGELPEFSYQIKKRSLIITAK